MLLNQELENSEPDLAKMLILTSTQVMYSRRLSGRGEVESHEESTDTVDET